MDDAKAKCLECFENYAATLPKAWNGIDCFNEMFASGYPRAAMAEWAGTYNEFRLERYLEENLEAARHIEFYQDRSRGGVDLDLKLPLLNAYADVKIHSTSSGAVIGNDCQTVDKILDEDPNASIYLLVTEVEARKDRNFGYETTVFWNERLNKENKYSYGKRMKHDAVVNRVVLLDINNGNKDRLSLFRQGRNSNGKPRNPKYKINKKDIGAFLVKEWNVS